MSKEAPKGEKSLKASKPVDSKPSDVKPVELKPEPKTPLEEFVSNVYLLEKAVSTKDSQLVGRVLRSSEGLRKKLVKDDVVAVFKQFVPSSGEYSDMFEGLNWLPASNKPIAAAASDMVVESPVTEMVEVNMEVKESRTSLIPEVEIYLRLFLFQLIFKNGGEFSHTQQCITSLMNRVQQWNLRTADLLVARVYYFYGLVQEKAGNLVAIRNFLLTSFRTACLHHDEASQAVLTNLIIRSYLSQNLYVLADKFRLNSTFPEHSSNYQFARYHYYIGLINAIQLDYSSSLENLKQALRKAPTNSAVGFRQTVTKFLVIVQMLMGEIPERSIFCVSDTRHSLLPYFNLTVAVRVGDLSSFVNVMQKHGDNFKKDKTFSLITRLRNNVIKTGLVKISTCYSRISIADICKKLMLDSEEDAESVVAKAIYDGVIDASIDHVNRFVYSKEMANVYAQNEPQIAFHKRIQFCLDLNTNSIKALRFPQHMKRDLVESEEERAERESAEAELLQQIEEGDGPDDVEDM